MNLFAACFDRKNGAPGPTRTGDPLLRRQMLYPPELQAHSRNQLPWAATGRPGVRAHVRVCCALFDFTSRGFQTVPKTVFKNTVPPAWAACFNSSILWRLQRLISYGESVFPIHRTLARRARPRESSRSFYLPEHPYRVKCSPHYIISPMELAPALSSNSLHPMATLSPGVA